jgi:hypothetical protein
MIRFCIAGSVNVVSGLVFNKVDISIWIVDKLVGQQSVKQRSKHFHLFHELDYNFSSNSLWKTMLKSHVFGTESIAGSTNVV